MRNKLTIQFDFEKNTPFIEVLRYNQSGELDIDLRDRHIDFFFEKLGYESDLVRVDFHVNECKDGKTIFQKIRLYPVPSEDLQDQCKRIEGLFNNVEKAPVDYYKSRPVNREDLMSPAEKAILDAMREVEKIPITTNGSKKLTDAAILLEKAKKAVYDHYMSISMTK